MKLSYLIIILSITSCSNNKSTISVEKNKIEHIHRTFEVGDIDNNSKKDIATIDYNFDNDNDILVCNRKTCLIEIKFGSNIPILKIDNSKGIFIKKTSDLNNDGANEIIIFARTNEGWWNNIYAFSLQKNKWIELAQTKGFLTEDETFTNRIENLNGNFFLLGDDWNENYDSIQMRSLRIQIK